MRRDSRIERKLGVQTPSADTWFNNFYLRSRNSLVPRSSGAIERHLAPAAHLSRRALAVQRREQDATIR